MAGSDHNREAYRLLFGYVGAGLQTFALAMIIISFPVAPTVVVVTLLGLFVISTVWSWRRYRTSFMMPSYTGTVIAAIWMFTVGLGAMLLGWGP